MKKRVFCAAMSLFIVLSGHAVTASIAPTNLPVVSAPAPPQTVIVTEESEPYVPTRVLVSRLVTNDVSVLLKVIDQIDIQDSGSRSVLEAFSPLLSHSDARVREAILDTVFTFDVVKPLLPALAKRLNDPEEYIRDDAIDVIADVETRQMIEILVVNTTNKYPDVRENCDFYLAFWTDQDFTNAHQWFSWWEKNHSTFVFE